MNRLIVIYLILLLVSTGKIFSQNNEMKARIEYEDAETAFQNKEYEKVVTYLTNVEKLLGNWTAKTSFLKIQALDQIVNYQEWNDNIAELYRQVKEYMKYADKNPNKIDIEKMREIYKIEKKVDFSKLKKDFESDTDYVTGNKAYDNKDYKVAMENFLKSAKKNNTRSMDAISDMYRDGLGVDVDYTKSLEWDTKASKLGDPISTSDIGSFYLSGLGVSQDYKKALEYLEAGAEYDIDYAMFNIGYIYYVGGNGITQNYTEAIKWFKKSADKGYGRAMNWLASSYRDGKGTTQNYNEAMSWYKKAIDKGHVASNLYIAYLYKNGNGVTKDFQEAIKWFDKTTQAGYNLNPSNMADLGYSYFQLQNYNKSMECYKKSYDAGDPKIKDIAKAWIAKMYEEGLGVKKDKKLAKEWRNK